MRIDTCWCSTSDVLDFRRSLKVWYLAFCRFSLVWESPEPLGSLKSKRHSIPSDTECQHQIELASTPGIAWQASNAFAKIIPVKLFQWNHFSEIISVECHHERTGWLHALTLIKRRQWFAGCKLLSFYYEANMNFHWTSYGHMVYHYDISHRNHSLSIRYPDCYLHNSAKQKRLRLPESIQCTRLFCCIYRLWFWLSY